MKRQSRRGIVRDWRGGRLLRAVSSRQILDVGIGAALLLSTVAPAYGQRIDSRTIEQIQGQLGVPSTNAGTQLDRAREQTPVAQPTRTDGGETFEEREIRRFQSRAILNEIYQPSPIEREFQERLGDPSLRQFGYDLFRSAQGEAGPLTGQVSDSYVLGVGDELVVTFQGATNDSETGRVDREGRLIVGQLRPIRAAGRSLGAVRRDLQAETRRTLLGTDVYISLGSVRAITVFVGGEVERPGQYQLTSLADVASALAQAGGVRRTGSLRNVHVARAGSASTSMACWGSAHRLPFGCRMATVSSCLSSATPSRFRARSRVLRSTSFAVVYRSAKP